MKQPMAEIIIETHTRNDYILLPHYKLKQNNKRMKKTATLYVLAIIIFIPHILNAQHNELKKEITVSKQIISGHELLEEITNLEGYKFFYSESIISIPSKIELSKTKDISNENERLRGLLKFKKWSSHRATAAEVIITSATMRKESRGLHYNLDYSEQDDKNWRHDTVI